MISSRLFADFAIIGFGVLARPASSMIRMVGS